MKTLCIVCSLLFGSFMAVAQTGEKNFIDQNYIEVTGTAEMEIVPDQIYLSIVISEKDKGKRTVEQQEKAMVAILQELGIDSRKDLLIKDVSSNFKSYFLKRTAIQTEKEYQLCLHGADKMGQLLPALEAAGISNISVSRVDHSRLDQYRQEVKIQAVKIAKAKAAAFAEAVGQQAGRALYIGESENSYFIRQNAMSSNIRVRGTGAVTDTGAPLIDFEKIPLKSSVLVRFELK